MNPADRLEEIKALVLYSEIYNQRPTPAFLKTLLSRLNRIQFLQLMCALSSIVHNNLGVAMDQAWQVAFVRSLGNPPGSDAVLKKLIGSKCVLLHAVQIGLLCRYAFQYCKAEAAVDDFSEVILRLLLATNELYTNGTDRRKSTSPRQAFFSVEVQAGTLPNERLANVMQRYYRFFQWCNRLSEDADDYLPLNSDFTRLMSMSPGEYLAAAFSVMTAFLSIKSVNDLQNHPPLLNFRDFGSTLERREALDLWIGRFSQADSDLSEPTPEPTFSVADLAPFIERPLVTVEKDYICCPLPSLLEDTLNTRLYFALFDAYSFTDGLARAKTFSRLQGHFFESYVGELITMMVAEGYKTHREVSYAAPGGQRKSTDVVAIRAADSCAVFIEVTKARFRLVESLFKLDEAAVMKDIEWMIIGKARQIQRSWDDLTSDLYSYPQDVSSMAPLIVTGQGIPGLIYLKHRIDETLRDENILQSTEPLTYCDIEELEALALADPGNIDLYGLLVEKARHPDLLARVQSLKNYLHYYRTDISRKTVPRETVFPEYEEAIRSMIFPALRSWGLPNGSA